MCVAIDLTAAFDTVSHDILISKIAGSSLSPAITRWLSCYLRGVKLQLASEVLSRARESYAPASPKDASCHLHCSTITSLICQGQLHRSRGFVTLDDITVWAYGPKIPQMESMLNSYLRDVSIYMKENSLLISARKSPVTLFTPDKHQFQTHHDITLEDTHLPLERSPKILGVIMDPSLSFHKH